MKLELFVEQINDDRITLKTADEQIIYWPTDKFPKNIKEGEVINFSINHSSSPEGNDLAKNILNEILDSE
jgi:hypothetical protein